MRGFLFAGVAVVFLTLSGMNMPAYAEISEKSVVQNYTELVYANYKDAYKDALSLQKTVDAFLAKPSKDGLNAARKAWLKARQSYGQTEAFRFYDGPIDFTDAKNKQEGPEARLNAWPLNEAYIDYVKGNLNAGIIQDKVVPIDKKSLAAQNQTHDEADVTTGYHAIEFLLWGQDFSLKSAGKRPYRDYVKGISTNDRRRTYLKSVTDLLVEDLKSLVDAWKPYSDNYAKTFTEGDGKHALGEIITGLTTLSGFELASERMATALDSGDQEDEQSCFSDNTHNDFIYNIQGIRNVYLGKYGAVAGHSLYEFLKMKDEKLADALLNQINMSSILIKKLPHPIDAKILAASKNDPARKMMEQAISSLQKQAELFKKVGQFLKLDVKITGE